MQVLNKIKVERMGVVLSPRNSSNAKFNAGMAREGDKVHMLYRCADSTPNHNGISIDYLSDYICYAELDVNGKLVRDFEEPVIKPFNDSTTLGCQDPRIIPFEGEYYIFYTAWNGAICRVGVIKTADFKKYENLGIIPTEQWDKDAFILPERIDGKIVYIHRIEPNIQIDYFDSITDMFSEEYWKDYEHRIMNQVVISPKFKWENKKVGGSIPPIKTDIGWLFIYHGVADDRTPFCYRAGVALLDLKDPSKVIARLPYPLLEPVEEYEVKGDVNNVVFPQGAYIHDGWLYFSYGGADKVVAIARVNFDELLSELKNHYE